MRYFLLGFDPAQTRDYAALAAVEVTRNDNDLLLRLFALERRQRLSYPDLVSWAAAALKIPDFNTNVTRPPELVLDSTGVGIAIRDLLIKAGVSPIAVSWTSGNVVTKDDERNYHVGKAVLVGKFIAAFDAGRFLVNPNLPMYPQFEKELLAYKAEISSRGNAVFEAGKGEHDDLLSACILATWWAEARPKPKPQPRLVIPRADFTIASPWKLPSITDSPFSKR